MEMFFDVFNVFIYGSYRGYQVVFGNYFVCIFFKDQVKVVDIYIKVDLCLEVEKGIWK